MVGAEGSRLLLDSRMEGTLGKVGSPAEQDVAEATAKGVAGVASVVGAVAEWLDRQEAVLEEGVEDTRVVVVLLLLRWLSLLSRRRACTPVGWRSRR